MEQLNFFPLAIPSNVYGFAHLKGDRSRVLVATLEKQIFCIEYSDNQFTCNEVHFAYIPNGADIISIDAYQRTVIYDIVVGITFFKNSKESDSNELRKNASQSSNRSLSNSDRNQTWNHYYFNVYSSFVSMNRFDLNQIAQDCQTFELEFVPFHLYHTNLKFEDQSTENVWLLSGSDCCVHIFREDIKKQCFYKEKMDLFPELSNYKSIALWIDVMNLERDHEYDMFKRITTIGCEDGSVELFVVEYEDPTRPEIIRSYKQQYDGPILSVRLFRDQSNTQLELSLKERLHLKRCQDTNIHLFVANSYEAPVVYRNVLQDGLLFKKALPTPNKMDILLASFIADFNCDGVNEILIGKYSKELIIYRYDEQSDAYVISDQMKFANPLQVIAYLDLTGNGIRELVIITTKGVVIQRHRFSEIAKILEDKVGKCLNLIK